MDDSNEVIDLCATPGQRSEASGPPVKRFRGVDSVDEGSQGGPSPTEEGGPQLEGPSSQMGSAQHVPIPSPSLSLGRASRNTRTLAPNRLLRDQMGPFNGGLWGEPQPMPGSEATSSGIDLALNSSLPTPQLHWARKSQRQNRSTQRQQLGNPSDPPPEEGFPSRLTPPNLPWVPPEHHRMPTLLGMGRMDRVPREAQPPGARRPRRMDMYPFDYDMDDIELFDGFDSLEPGEFGVGMNPGPTSNVVGEPDGARSNARRSNRRCRLMRDAEGPRLRSFLPRDEILDEIDDPPVTPQQDLTGMAAMRERIRQLESRRSMGAARDQVREQTREAFMRRRARHQGPREGRGASLREEFGALMNVLGLVPPLDGAPGSAMMGMARSGLPPHLLFTDRDFTGEDYEFLCRLDEGVENRKGADEETINKLQATEFEEECAPRAPVDEPCNRCPICLEEFSKGDAMRVMPCSHNYHKDCLDKWLRIKAVCPICNLNIRKEG
ncbi:hypothetical protein BSKO_01297 [Bryopsis sp. KO-2023]|nr:hypothetical protein BSKO_01297 [Bryopsis sp. KO-2023]